jgi:hypothetical protein
VGEPRSIGTAPDMGAFERPQRPTVGHLKKTKVSHRLAKLTVPINPEGLETTVRFITKHGHSHANAMRSTGAGATTKHLKIRLHGLAPGQHYTIVVKAKNGLGHATSNVLKIATPKARKHHQHH